MKRLFLRWVSKGTKKRRFRLFQIESTLRCNLHCSMCPWHEMRAPQADMDWETYEKIAKNFDQVEEIDLAGGGEPLMHPQLLRMIALAKESGCRAGFSTNATLLFPKVSEELIQSDLDWIAYSVDGATAGTYEKIRRGASFNEVIEHISFLEKLREKHKYKKPLTMLFFVMMPNNFHELPTLVDLCLHLGIDKLVIKNQDVILKMERDRERLFTWGPHESEELQRIIKVSLEKAQSKGLFMRVYELSPREMTVCEQDPLNTAFFNWQGYVSPCITLSYAQERIFQGRKIRTPLYRFGNINDETFRDIWHCPAYRKFRNIFEKRNRNLRHKLMDVLVAPGFGNKRSTDDTALPPPPEGCETCSYLYGL
ncbi:MAG: radical SAM protein [Desulfobacterales bacterium]|nr:radical SAM protein [Desulfobacterales bacterium]